MSAPSSNVPERLLPASLARRCLAFFLDAFLSVALAVLLSFAFGMGALKGMPGFVSAYEATFSSVDAMERLEEEAGLSILDEKGRSLENKDAYDAFLRREIAYSYEVNPSAYEGYGQFVSSYPPGGPGSDLLGYFYLCSPLLDGSDARLDLEGFAAFFFSYFPREGFFLSGEGFPTIKADLAVSAVAYLEEGGEKPSFYDLHLRSYLDAREHSLAVLSGLDPFARLLAAYEEGFRSLSGYEFGAAATAFALAWLIVAFLPGLCTSRGWTFGGFLSSLPVAKESRERAPFGSRAALGLLSFLGSSWLLFAVVGFTYGFSILTAPFLLSFDYLGLLLAFLGLFILDKAPLLTHERNSLSEMITSTSRFELKR